MNLLRMGTKSKKILKDIHVAGGLVYLFESFVGLFEVMRGPRFEVLCWGRVSDRGQKTGL